MDSTSEQGKTAEVLIDGIGGHGDGIAELSGERLYIAGAAPGDRLRVALGPPRGDGRAARLLRILSPGPDRIDPACRHFGRCGGCALQHLASPAIAATKRNLVAAALARRGLNVAVEETVVIPPGRRRRVSLALHRAGRTILGFNERASRRVLDIAECPAALPEIVQLFDPLRALCTGLDALGRSADIQITLSNSGPDLLFRPARSTGCDLEARQALASFADRYDIARIAWQESGTPEPVVARRPVVSDFAGVAVTLPCGIFLQPSADGEAAIVAILREALRGAHRIADLYAGCGSLTFPAARIGHVHAVEGDSEMAAALRRAATGLPISVEHRDLARAPLDAAELARFDAVVFDPPRAGAAAQARHLAQAAASTVVAVSCNPATLARDLRALVDGGYRIERVTPIDQFSWSSHVEAVAVLRRQPTRPTRPSARGGDTRTPA